jgi:hypothetical protein
MQKHHLPFPQRLEKEAKELIDLARGMQVGEAREKILRKARQFETAIHINEWLSSPSLQAPK